MLTLLAFSEDVAISILIPCSLQWAPTEQASESEDEGISGTGRDYEAQARGARAEMPSLTPQAASRRSLWCLQSRYR